MHEDYYKANYFNKYENVDLQGHVPRYEKAIANVNYHMNKSQQVSYPQNRSQGIVGSSLKLRLKMTLESDDQTHNSKKISYFIDKY